MPNFYKVAIFYRNYCSNTLLINQLLMFNVASTTNNHAGTWGVRMAASFCFDQAVLFFGEFADSLRQVFNLELYDYPRLLQHSSTMESWEHNSGNG